MNDNSNEEPESFTVELVLPENMTDSSNPAIGEINETTVKILDKPDSKNEIL